MSDARARKKFNPDYLTSFKAYWYPNNREVNQFLKSRLGVIGILAPMLR